MSSFNTTLLREKFIIQDAVSGELSDKPPIVALSNRMAVPMIAENGELEEAFIIRAQNMHTCARMAAHLTKEYHEGGPLLTRPRPFDWEGGWLNITSGYEKKWNPGRWVAIYHKGRIVYEAAGESQRHPFLDIIEQCDALNKGAYEKSLKIAEDAFRQAGKLVEITYDGNIAMVMNIADEEGKVGLILRGPNRTTTFNFTARKKQDRQVKPSQCLSAAAAFLEGIQMTFMVGMVAYKVKHSMLDKKSPEAKQGNEAGQKLARLKGAVDQFEKLFDVSYRPERPDLGQMVDSAELFAAKLLEKQSQQKKEQDGKKNSDER
jgi:hypothetical protein